METAKKVDFCKVVLNIKDTEKATNWVSRTCTENNLGNNKCLKYMHKYVKACTEQNESRKISKSELFKNSFKKGFNKALNEASD